MNDCCMQHQRWFASILQHALIVFYQQTDEKCIRIYAGEVSTDRTPDKVASFATAGLQAEEAVMPEVVLEPTSRTPHPLLEKLLKDFVSSSL